MLQAAAGHRRAAWLLAAVLAGCQQVAVIGGVETVAGRAAAPLDAAMSGESPALDAGEPAGPSLACERPAVAVCDPVMNSGCPDILAMQCAIDHGADVTAGYCIFQAPNSMMGPTCLNTVVTESCPPRSTCVGGMCRTLCFCDIDCNGECCNQPVGAHRFRACGPC
jgi:hypothetical protein